jgi:hypothetical protein
MTGQGSLENTGRGSLVQRQHPRVVISACVVAFGRRRRVRDRNSERDERVRMRRERESESERPRE